MISIKPLNFLKYFSFLVYLLGLLLKIYNLQFVAGCNGNLKAIGRLLEGQDAKHAADILRGNECGNRGTSCADQLAIAINEALQ